MGLWENGDLSARWGDLVGISACGLPLACKYLSLCNLPVKHFRRDRVSRASRKSACSANVQAPVQVEAVLSALASAACLFLVC